MERRARQREERKWKRKTTRKAESRRSRTDAAYLDWIRSLPCAVCGAAPRNEAHHEPTKSHSGGGAWHDRKTIPLCTACHTGGPKARHTFGSVKNWQLAVGISAEALIARLNAAYEVLQAPGTRA